MCVFPKEDVCKSMKRLKKKIFIGLGASTLLVLGIVRRCNPSVMDGSLQASALSADSSKTAEPLPEEIEDKQMLDLTTPASMASPNWGRNRIRGVYSYDMEFPDLQEVQIKAARKWGVSPVRDRQEAEERKEELVYIAAHPFYSIDSRMSRSVPYLVPRASRLLQDIGRNYLDSLASKGIPLHKIVVSSVLRTEEDVAKLMRINGNASDQSCHRFGTTFDISYNRYETVCPPGETRREVRNDTLKYVLSEVLRDLRNQGRCYIKYERKQPCFHITTR